MHFYQNVNPGNIHVYSMLALIYYLRGRVTERERERDAPYADSLSQWLLKLGQAETASQDLHPGLPCGNKGQMLGLSSVPFHGTSARSWMGSQAAATCTKHSSMICCYSFFKWISDLVRKQHLGFYTRIALMFPSSSF